MFQIYWIFGGKKLLSAVFYLADFLKKFDLHCTLKLQMIF